MKKIKHAKTAQAGYDLEVEKRIYYSITSGLEYFDPILHTVKCITSLEWQKKDLDSKGLVKEKELKEIQARVDNVAVLSTIGHIPRKIASAFDGVVDELDISILYALHDLIGKEYECWRSFVLACRLLTLPVLSDMEIKKADLLNFCRKVEILYGKQEVTPNMHLYGHLTGVWTYAWILAI